MFSDKSEEESAVDITFQGTVIQKLDEDDPFTIVNLDEGIKQPSYYRDVFNLMLNAGKEETIVLRINSYGGDLETAIQFYNTMLACDAMITAEIYCALSAAAMIALSANEIFVSEFSSMMIHSGEWNVADKARNMKHKSVFFDKQNETIARKLYKSFLTEEEITDVIKGKDIWLNDEEISMRLVNWIPVNNDKSL